MSPANGILRDCVRACVWGHIRVRVGDRAWAHVGARVGASVEDRVWDRVGASVDHIADRVRDGAL